MPMGINMWVNLKMENLLSRNSEHSEQHGLMKKLLGIKYTCGIFILLIILQAYATDFKWNTSYETKSDENSDVTI